MDYYMLKTNNSTQDYVTIIQETEEGYMIRINRDLDGYEEVRNEYITKELFESCLRTGYLTKVTKKQKAMAIA